MNNQHNSANFGPPSLPGSYSILSQDDAVNKQKSNRIDSVSPKSIVEAAKVSPAAVFAAPEDVVGAAFLTKREKIEVLDQWEADAKAEQTATDEGMSGGMEPRLDEVNAAQSDLDVKKVFPPESAPRTKS